MFPISVNDGMGHESVVHKGQRQREQHEPVVHKEPAGIPPLGPESCSQDYRRNGDKGPYGFQDLGGLGGVGDCDEFGGDLLGDRNMGV